MGAENANQLEEQLKLTMVSLQLTNTEKDPYQKNVLLREIGTNLTGQNMC